MNVKADDVLKSDFCIEIQYKRNSENPSRVFRSMSELIESFQSIDRTLVKVIDVRIEPVLMLEDIGTGSIKSWLHTTLKMIPDDSVYNLTWQQIIGQYLLRAKKYLVDFTKDKTTISNINEIKPLQDNLDLLADQTKVKMLPAYNRIQPRELMEGITNISQSLSYLTEGDSAKYIINPNDTAAFNLSFKLAPESIEDLISKETIVSESEMILKVKKPDYLAESMWDFRHGTKIIPANISDKEWLDKFQSRQVEVRPKDSIHAVVKASFKYDYDGELIAEHYSVTKVIKVIAGSDQLNMFNDKDVGNV